MRLSPSPSHNRRQYTYMSGYLDLYVHIHVCGGVYTYTYSSTYTYIYTHRHTHTCTCIYIYRLLLQGLNRSRPAKPSCVQQTPDLFSILLLSECTHTHTERETCLQAFLPPITPCGHYLPPHPAPATCPSPLHSPLAFILRAETSTPPGSACTGWGGKASHPPCPSPQLRPPPPISAASPRGDTDDNRQPRTHEAAAQGPHTKTCHTRTRTRSHTYLLLEGRSLPASIRGMTETKWRHKRPLSSSNSQPCGCVRGWGGVSPTLCHPSELCCPLPHRCLIPGCT